MRLARGALVLAIVAALWGAPSSVSAAMNELSAPQVSVSSPAAGRDAAGVLPASDTEPRDDSASTEEMVSDVLLVGVAGVASVAIVGTLLLIAGRRRESAPSAMSSAASVADEAPVRRRVTTARTRPSDDPIVAALGVDDEMAARRAIRRAGRAAEDAKGPKRP